MILVWIGCSVFSIALAGEPVVWETFLKGPISQIDFLGQKPSLPQKSRNNPPFRQSHLLHNMYYQTRREWLAGLATGGSLACGWVDSGAGGAVSELRL
jgi:hypothetical protein